MKTKRLLSIALAALMLIGLVPAGAYAGGAEAAETVTVTPDCGDGVELEYGELTLRVTEAYGLLKAAEDKTLSVTAHFAEGWTYSESWSSFFTGHADAVSVTNGSDGSKTFTLSVHRGDVFTRDELSCVGIYASAAELPKLEIEAVVPFSQIDKEEWVDASFTLTLGTKQYASGNYEGTGGIKGRGNTSWGQPKKPYSIKLASKASLLDIPKTKKYAIVPGYSDGSLVRNWMTYKASLLLSGIEYVPKCELVEVYLNGVYNGIYILVERVDIESNKINIPEATADELTGGYLIEKDIDGKIDFSADQWFNCPYWANQSRDYFVLKTPETEDEALKEQMLAYLTDYMQSVHNAVTDSGSEAWTQYVDAPSWIDFIILQEIAKNIDGNLKTSCYLVKKAQDDKLYLTAPWDFDLAWGSTAVSWNNADYSHNDYYDCPDAQSAAGFMTINSSCPWFDKLYDDHAAFRDALTLRYGELRQSFVPELLRLLRKGAAYISAAVPRDEQKWGVRVNAATQYLENWIHGRLEWLDSEWLEQEEIDLDYAMNAEGGRLHFTPGEQYPFRGTVKDGRAAAVCGNAGVDSSVSTVTLTLEMEAGQTLAFDYKVSSESGYDTFSFKVNGSSVLSKSGEVDWTRYTYTAGSSGSFTFTWSYSKDYSVASGADCAWVDEVAWSGSPAGLPGDANGDGSVDSADALLILRYSMGLPGDIIVENADVNGDGSIDSTDAVLVLRNAMFGE